MNWRSRVFYRLHTRSRLFILRKNVFVLCSFPLSKNATSSPLHLRPTHIATSHMTTRAAVDDSRNGRGTLRGAPATRRQRRRLCVSALGVRHHLRRARGVRDRQPRERSTARQRLRRAVHRPRGNVRAAASVRNIREPLRNGTRQKKW